MKAIERFRMATVRCLFAADLQVDAGFRCASHTHACTEIIYYYGASGTLVQDGNPLAYKDGSVAVYQPHQSHLDETEVAGSHLCVGVTGVGAGDLSSGMWVADGGVGCAADLLRQELVQPYEPQGDRLDVLAAWLALEVRRLTSTDQAPSSLPYHVSAAKEILDTRFAEPLSLREIADNLFIHPDYLRQLFKQTLGESPLHYLIQRRLDVACELLRVTGEPIKVIARRVGLGNPYYFSRLFRKWLKVTPTRYRLDHRSSSDT